MTRVYHIIPTYTFEKPKQLAYLEHDTTPRRLCDDLSAEIDHRRLRMNHFPLNFHLGIMLGNPRSSAALV